MSFQCQAELLYNARKTAGLTQAKLAKRIGLTGPQLVSNVERGYCGFSPKRWRRIAKVTNVTLREAQQALLNDYQMRVTKQLS